MHATYIKAKRNAIHAKHSIGSVSPFRRSRVLPEEQQALLSDEPNPGSYSVGTRGAFDTRSRVEGEEQA